MSQGSISGSALVLTLVSPQGTPVFVWAVQLPAADVGNVASISCGSGGTLSPTGGPGGIPECQYATASTTTVMTFNGRMMWSGPILILVRLSYDNSTYGGQDQFTVPGAATPPPPTPPAGGGAGTHTGSGKAPTEPPVHVHVHVTVVPVSRDDTWIFYLLIALGLPGLAISLLIWLYGDDDDDDDDGPPGCLPTLIRPRLLFQRNIPFTYDDQIPFTYDDRLPGLPRVPFTYDDPASGAPGSGIDEGTTIERVPIDDGIERVPIGGPELPPTSPFSGPATSTVTTSPVSSVPDCSELRRACEEARAAQAVAEAKGSASATAAAEAQQACRSSRAAVAAAQQELDKAIQSQTRPGDSSWVENAATGERVTVGDSHAVNAAAQAAMDQWRSGQISAQQLEDEFVRLASPEAIQRLREQARKNAEARVAAARKSLADQKGIQDRVCGDAETKAGIAATDQRAADQARQRADAACAAAADCEKASHAAQQGLMGPPGGGQPEGGAGATSGPTSGGGTTPGTTSGGPSTTGAGPGSVSTPGASGGGSTPGGPSTKPSTPPSVPPTTPPPTTPPTKPPTTPPTPPIPKTGPGSQLPGPCQKGQVKEANQQQSKVFEWERGDKSVHMVVTGGSLGAQISEEGVSSATFVQNLPDQFRAKQPGGMAASKLYHVVITMDVHRVQYECLDRYECDGTQFVFKAHVKKTVLDQDSVRKITDKGDLGWDELKAAIRGSWGIIGTIMRSADKADAATFCPGGQGE